MLEVALGEPPRRARGTRRSGPAARATTKTDAGQRQQQEGEQDRDDQQAAVGDRALQVRGLVEDHEPGRRAHRLAGSPGGGPGSRSRPTRTPGSRAAGPAPGPGPWRRRGSAPSSTATSRPVRRRTSRTYSRGIGHRHREHPDRIAVGAGQAQARRRDTLARGGDLPARGPAEGDGGHGRIGALELVHANDRSPRRSPLGHGGPQRSVAGDPPQRGASALRSVLVDRQRRPDPGGDAGVRLAGLALRRQPQEHEGEGDHRDDHDDREEDPQASAEAHSTVTLKPRLPLLFGPRAARVEACIAATINVPLLSERRLRGYSSVGRAPGSHPGGRGFESP